MMARKGRKFRRRRLHRRKRFNKESVYRMPKRSGAIIVPDKFFTKLTFVDTAHSKINNLTAYYASIRYRPTSVYDIDPTLGSSSIPGFSELANFYLFYRVHAFRYKFMITNTEANPIVCIAAPSQVDLGADYSSLNSMIGNPYCKNAIISITGGMDRCMLKGYVNIRKYVGSKTVEYDDNYASGVATTPVNNVYINVGGQIQNGTAFANDGLAVTVVISCYVEFYERKILTS